MSNGVVTPAVIFHIRKRLRKAGGNQFYKDRSDRNQGTYCGADYTDCDIRWNDKAEPWDDRIPCPACVAKREAE